MGSDYFQTPDNKVLIKNTSQQSLVKVVPTWQNKIKTQRPAQNKLKLPKIKMKAKDLRMTMTNKGSAKKLDLKMDQLNQTTLNKRSDLQR